MTDSVARVAEVPTVVLEGAVDPGTVIQLHRRISDVLGDGQRPVVVDVEAVTVLGAQTLSLLCAVLRRVGRRGARVAIVGARGPVGGVLELCAIDGLELHPSVSAAVSALTVERA